MAHEAVTHWLNFGDSDDEVDDGYRNSKESQNRIENLLNFWIQTLGGFREQMLPHYEKRTQDARLVTFLGQDRMSEYATFPFLAYQPSGNRWGIGTKPASPLLRPYGEVVAAHGILELACSGLLDRIRRCGNAECNRWFFATRDDSKFHKDVCRKQIWEKSGKRAASNRANAKLRHEGIGETHRGKLRKVRHAKAGK